MICTFVVAAENVNGAMAETCVEETYTSGAGTPSNKTSVSANDVATCPVSLTRDLADEEVPRLAPKTVTISPGATPRPRKLAALTTAVACGGLVFCWVLV